MNLRTRFKQPGAMQRLGFSFLIIASLARWLMHPHTGMSQDFIDATTGFLYGVAIASLLASVWMRRPRRPTPGGHAGA